MTIQDFIEENRDELTKAVKGALGRVSRTASCHCTPDGSRCPLSGTDHYHEPEPLDDDELESWILNDESLYNWARNEGVQI